MTCCRCEASHRSSGVSATARRATGARASRNRGRTLEAGGWGLAPALKLRAVNGGGLWRGGRRQDGEEQRVYQCRHRQLRTARPPVAGAEGRCAARGSGLAAKPAAGAVLTGAGATGGGGLISSGMCWSSLLMRRSSSASASSCSAAASPVLRAPSAASAASICCWSSRRSATSACSCSTSSTVRPCCDTKDDSCDSADRSAATSCSTAPHDTGRASAQPRLQRGGAAPPCGDLLLLARRVDGVQ